MPIFVKTADEKYTYFKDLCMRILSSDIPNAVNLTTGVTLTFKSNDIIKKYKHKNLEIDISDFD